MKTIQERAEAFADTYFLTGSTLHSLAKKAYIAGATEERALMEQQTASLEERVKELEGEVLHLQQLLTISGQPY